MTRQDTNADEPTVMEIELGLRATASGVFALEAAVDLLISHRRWLTRADFRDLIEVEVPGKWQRLAWVDWDRLDPEAFPASSSETTVLKVAASLATGAPVCLGEVVGGLDEHTVTAIAAAVLHANGNRDAAIRLVWPGGS
ncbi:MAG: hypothetical protein ACRDQA_16880 [Nocardioidaceae bacterium]